MDLKRRQYLGTLKLIRTALSQSLEPVKETILKKYFNGNKKDTK